MKRLPITLTVLSLAAIALLGVVSCQKEKTEEKPIVQQDPEAQRALERISEFKNKVKDHRNNSLARSSETISLEDALWNIENVFNATYSQPDIVCSATSDFEFSLYLSVDADGNVLECDLLDLYDTAVASARKAYAHDGFTNKVFRFLLVNADNPTNGIVRMCFKGRTGERSSVPQTPYQDTVCYRGPFRGGDNYHYDYGKCDGTGTDGADEMLTYHVGSYIASQLVTPSVGTRALYINPNEVILLGINYQNDLFYSADVNATCIDFNNMNRLYNTEKALVTVTLPSDPQGVVYGMIPIDISVQSDTKPQYIAHNNLVIYAQRTIADLNDVGDTEDLLNE